MFKQILRTKIFSSIFLKFVALGLIGIWVFGFGVCYAQERGIGVTPGTIEIAEPVDWPYTVPVTVTNFSAEQEQFEILFEKSDGVIVSALPARFALEAGASNRVMITFEEPAESTEGLIKVLSPKTSEQGFVTGTGIKIPFRVGVDNNAKFLAGASEAAGSFSYMLGSGLVLITVFLLWQIAQLVRLWMFNSNKQ